MEAEHRAADALYRGLLSSGRAWCWWSDGRLDGWLAGYARGHAAGVWEARTVLDDAAAYWADLRRPRWAAVAAAERRAERDEQLLAEAIRTSWQRTAFLAPGWWHDVDAGDASPVVRWLVDEHRAADARYRELLASPRAWAWYSEGRAVGEPRGYDRGWSDGYSACMRVLVAGGALPDTMNTPHLADLDPPKEPAA